MEKQRLRFAAPVPVDGGEVYGARIAPTVRIFEIVTGAVLTARGHPAIDFLSGASGRLEAVTLLLSEPAEVPLVRVRASSPELVRVVLDGGGAPATGLDVAGAQGTVAAPSLRECHLARLGVGVLLGPDAQPELVANTFDEVGAELCPGDPGCPPAGGHGASGKL